MPDQELPTDLPALHAHAVQQIRKAPQDTSARALFIQLLCMEGEWERATTQADALLKLNPASALFCTTVGQLIAAEGQRMQVLAGKRPPQWMGSRPAYADALEASLRAYGAGDMAAGAAATMQVLDALPGLAVGFASGTAADWLLDGDARLAGVLEVVKGDSHSLIAMAEVAALEIAAPTHPVEVLWPHVRLTLAGGEILTARMPGRYPLAAGGSDSALLMARATAWQELPEGLYLGSGQRCWNCPEGVLPMLTERVLRFHPA